MPSHLALSTPALRKAFLSSALRVQPHPQHIFSLSATLTCFSRASPQPGSSISFLSGAPPSLLLGQSFLSPRAIFGVELEFRIGVSKEIKGMERSQRSQPQTQAKSSNLAHQSTELALKSVSPGWSLPVEKRLGTFHLWN